MAQTPRIRQVSITRTRRGQIEIKFTCPRCSNPLVSMREKIGTTQQCSHCQQAFILSGEIERQIRSEEEAESEAKLEQSQREEAHRLAEAEREQLESQAAERQRREDARHRRLAAQQKLQLKNQEKERELREYISAPVKIETYPLVEIYCDVLKIAGVGGFVLAGLSALVTLGGRGELAGLRDL